MRKKDKENMIVGFVFSLITVPLVMIGLSFVAMNGSWEGGGETVKQESRSVLSEPRSIEELTFVPIEERTPEEQRRLEKWAKTDAYLRYGYEGE